MRDTGDTGLVYAGARAGCPDGARSPPAMERSPPSRPSHRPAADPEAAGFLTRLGAGLAPLEAELEAGPPGLWPHLFVVGVPRAGTTLFMQRVARHLGVGYPSNLMAAFRGAPAVGARLARILLVPGVGVGTQSTYGGTRGPAEPHELGGLWRELLGPGCYTEGADPPLDGARLARVLDAIAAAAAAPYISKALSFAWQLPAVADALPRAGFVHLVRDPVELGLSLLAGRSEYLGDPRAWLGLKPAGWEDQGSRPLPEQVAFQVHGILRALEAGLARVAPERVLRVAYPELCREPDAVLDRVAAWLAAAGTPVARLHGAAERVALAPPRPGPALEIAAALARLAEGAR